MRKARPREAEVGSCKIQGKQQHSFELSSSSSVSASLSSSSSSASSLVLEALILLQAFDRHIQHLHMCGLYIYSSIRQHMSAYVSIRQHTQKHTAPAHVWPGANSDTL